MELAKIKDDLERHKGHFGYSHASGFSIAESDSDKLKVQLRNLTQTYEEEKHRKDLILKEQDEEVKRTTEEIE